MQVERGATTSATAIADKATRLFTYLKELCALRTLAVRDVAQYEEVLWISDVPLGSQGMDYAKSCLLQPAPEDGENDEANWIEIHKPRLKEPPALPDELKEWVDDAELHNSVLNEPELHDHIVVPLEPAPETGDVRTKTIAIDDRPDIFGAWIDYLETQWKSWAEEDRRLQSVQRVYDSLFRIHQKQENLGEQYETVLGVGLLVWKAPNSARILRHAITFQARTTFDPERGCISVVPGIDGPQPNLELEMLETADRPPATDFTALEDRLSNVTSPNKLSPVLKTLANVLSTEGQFHDTNSKIDKCTTRPLVSPSPALILRRRNRRTFVSFYERILEELGSDGRVPENIRRILEVVEGEGDPRDDSGDDSGGPETQKDAELYFPLPANAEQEEIVQRLAAHRGVLVQGPPGTGKSHTICNLISHFLAKGKKVLVTSETPRALNVLTRMIPEEIRELCVMWLGSGPDSRESLEKSVQGILRRKTGWNNAFEEAEIRKAVKDLHNERMRQATLQSELCALREVDSYKHRNVCGKYSGTLQEIAATMAAERSQYSWFLDAPGQDEQPTVSGQELRWFCRWGRRITQERLEELKRVVPKSDQLLAPDEFQEAVKVEMSAAERLSHVADGRKYKGYNALLAMDGPARRDVLSHLNEISALYEHLVRHHHAFAAQAAREIAADQDRTWRQLLNETGMAINRISEACHRVSNWEIVGYGNHDLSVVKADALALISRLEANKWMGWGPVRPKVVKGLLYLLHHTRVDGKLCNDLETLHKLVAWLDVGITLKRLGTLWGSHVSPPEGAYSVQLVAYQDLCEPLREALGLHGRVQSIASVLRGMPGLLIPRWSDETQVEALREAIMAAEWEQELRKARTAFAPIQSYLRSIANGKNSHELSGHLMSATKAKNWDDYAIGYGQLIELEHQKDELLRSQAILRTLEQSAPLTAGSFRATWQERVWEQRFGDFESAWTWAQANGWLANLVDKNAMQRINREIDESQEKQRQLIQFVAACRAWQHCITSLGEWERQALVAWQQAVSRVKGGKGRHAERHRETARRNLQKCRKAVPCWIMPLYQLVQTVAPSPEIFDVVIIDEASQSGPEALFLNYIGRQLVVVGDDKQITPLHVGINRDDVEHLRQRYLNDMDFTESLGLDGSLFSEAAQRFPYRVCLREHFRCMPEIIQFANTLSYSAEALIPLRQYGAKRLQPVSTCYVKGGYRKGKSSHVENPPEAEAIVRKIAECCNDPAYDSKEFGVIALLGHRQSRLIADLLIQEIGAEEMERRRLVCGEPYDFQGDERNVIFLSLVDAPVDGRDCRMVRSEAMRRRLNVATSRAKDQLWVFHSMTLNHLRRGCLRYKLLDYCFNPRVQQPPAPEIELADLQRRSKDPLERQQLKPPGPFDSWFEVDVYLQIVARGYRVRPQFEVVDRRRIDLVVEGLQGCLAVECDGDAFHGPEQHAEDAARQRQLERCGWQFWRIRGSEYYCDPEAALQGLWEALDRRGIRPQAEWEEPEEPGKAMEPADSEKDLSETRQQPIGDARLLAGRPSVSLRSTVPKPESNGATHADDRSAEIARRLPTTGGEVDRVEPAAIQQAILQVLTESPNHSCIRDKVTKLVLGKLGIRTRGKPRERFDKRVKMNIGALKRKGLIEEYRARNRRIRLVKNAGGLF